jgi:fatty-acyl-CoA synthase
MRMRSRGARSEHAVNRALGTGLVPRMRPDKMLRARALVRSRGLTPATAYALGAIRYPRQAAIIDELGTLTFTDIDRRTSVLALALQDVIVPDATVAVMCRNHRGLVEMTVACSKLGADILYLDPDAPASALTRRIRERDPALLVHDEEFAGVLDPLCRGRRRLLSWCQTPRPGLPISLQELMHTGVGGPRDSKHAERACTITLADPASLNTPTAGTTLPSSLRIPGTALSQIPLRTREHTLIAAPLSSKWGFLHLILGMRLASTLVLHRTFDPVRALDAIAEHSLTSVALSTEMLHEIAELPAATMHARRTDTLRVIALPASTIEWDMAMPAVRRFGEILYHLHGPSMVRVDAVLAEPCRHRPDAACRVPWWI